MLKVLLFITQDNDISNIAFKALSKALNAMLLVVMLYSWGAATQALRLRSHNTRVAVL